MLELQSTLQIGVINELPYISKVPSKPTVVNSLDEAVKEQIPSDGVYQLVNFSNKDLGYKGIEQLLYSDKGVKAIRNGSSNLSDIYQGMGAKQGVMIVQLNLSNCNIGGLGADKLGQAIHSDSGLHSLQYLNLSNNNIDDSGIYSLASNAKGNSTPSLRWLDLSNNLLTDNGANSFHWAFKENKLYNLNYLDVSENNITQTGWE
jgi:Leucine-rich repeat (LRR) protein